MRLTTDAPLRLVRDELPFVLDRELHFVLGPDETLTQPIDEFVARRRAADHRLLARMGALPVDPAGMAGRGDPQRDHAEAVPVRGHRRDRRRADHLDPGGAGTARNWDYRYCWLRDAAFVVRALNRLGATRTMEEYIRYIFNLVTDDEPACSRVYGIGFETRSCTRRKSTRLAGYRGMGPVRRGNLAWLQQQHDVYGSVVLASTQLFFDQRLQHPGDVAIFRRLEPLGERAFALHDQPDAGLWEFRGRAEVHTYSAVMCWAACDRLAQDRGAASGCAERAALLARARRRIRDARAQRRAWNERARQFVDAFDGERLDAIAAAARRPRLRRGRRPALRRHRRGDRARAARGDGLFRYVAPGRLRRAGDQLHHLHVLVHRRARRDRPHGRGARAVRARARAAQSRSACCRRTSRSTAARPGATSRRPIRTSA